MAQITPNLSLKVWNNYSDPYNSEELATNFITIDQHDHSSGKGVQINGNQGIQNNSIGANKLTANSVVSTNLVDGTVTTSKIADSTGSTDGVTTAKIANAAVTRAKLASGVLPSTSLISFSGKGNLPTTGLFNGYELYYTPATNVVWHLRYNGSTWDFVGGGSYTNKNTTTISAFNGTAGNLYRYWASSGSTSNEFVFWNLPLAGTYKVEYKVTFGTPSTGTAVYQCALATRTPQNPAIVGDLSSGSGIYQYNTGGATEFTSLSGTDQITMSAGSYVADSTSAGTSQRVQIVAGALSKSTAGATATVPDQRITITPIGNLSNFT